ncbi:Acyltransferase family protein [Flexibacter flexilis DSM 6793]|uniref:Acyltransferase family protein n=1 Tax=Flexibacter flexilis DSM 6793 TaxID=927664 RepID=A0A1I1L9G8_9BACT|nr:Acyltransferase family protein [Flexibacter flexilis DSM 6793]
MIVFVIFIHNNIFFINLGTGTVVLDIPPYVSHIKYLVSDIIARIAVPLFFLISGYLLYLKENTFFQILTKKTKTIAVPYLVWTSLAILLFALGQHLTFTKAFFANPQNNITNFDILDYIDAVVGRFTVRSPYPLVYQFWFLRDLILLNFSAIIFKKIIDKFPIAFLFLAIFFWIVDYNLYLYSAESMLFFVLGYYIHKYNLTTDKIDSIQYFDILLLYAITICIELFCPQYRQIIHKINIIIGAVLAIKLSLVFVLKERIFNVLSQLSAYAFFVYAMHEPLLTVLRKISIKIMPTYGIYVLIQYFMVAFVCIAICLVVGVVLRKSVPKLYEFLSGGRA